MAYRTRNVLVYGNRVRSVLNLAFQIERRLGVVHEQEVVKDEEGRGDPSVFFPQEAGVRGY